MFEDLSRKLDGVLKRLRGQGKISEANVAETLREVRRVLLDADVNYKVARQFVDDVLRRAVGQDVLQSITPGQLIIKIIFDELNRLLGTQNVGITFAPMPPTVIMVAGLQGSGKTTFCAKLGVTSEGAGTLPAACGGGRAPSGCHRPASRCSASRSGSRSLPIVVPELLMLRVARWNMRGRMRAMWSSSIPPAVCMSMKI